MNHRQTLIHFYPRLWVARWRVHAADNVLFIVLPSFPLRKQWTTIPITATLLVTMVSKWVGVWGFRFCNGDTFPSWNGVWMTALFSVGELQLDRQDGLWSSVVILQVKYGACMKLPGPRYGWLLSCLQNIHLWRQCIKQSNSPFVLLHLEQTVTQAVNVRSKSLFQTVLKNITL